MKKIITFIQDMKKTAKGKALLFFLFYILFFLGLVLIARVGHRDTTQSSDYEKGNPTTFHVDSLLKNNYWFAYTVLLDDTKYEYVGERYNDMDLFLNQEKKYFRKENQYYLEEDSWKKVENPYVYPDFFNIEKVFQLLEKATYDSKTSYESGKVNYNYLLSTNTINQEFYQVNSDFMEEPNVVIISTDENREVNHIIFQLDSFCQLNSACEKSLKIELQYDKFGEVEKIDNPIE